MELSDDWEAFLQLLVLFELQEHWQLLVFADLKYSHKTQTHLNRERWSQKRQGLETLLDRP
jgi:hypothetical protein